MMSEEQESHIIMDGDTHLVADYLNDLEALVLLTPLSYKAKKRFLDLIDKLRTQLERSHR